MKATRWYFAVFALTLMSWSVGAQDAGVDAKGDALDSGLDKPFQELVEDELSEPTLIEKMQAIDKVDPAKWGIRKDCISIRNIRNISFQDDQSAIIKVGRGKEVLMRLRRECRGIRHEGFIYQARGSRLCARFDRLKLYKTGITCQIESFEPYIKVESIKPGEGEES